MSAHEKAATAVSRQIMLKFQGHDLARETDDGMVQMSGRQIELLERLCNEAAGAAITAYLDSMREQGWVMVPLEPTEAMLNAALATSDARIAELEAEVERLKARPKVKPLEWRDDWSAITPFGLYVLDQRDDEAFYFKRMVYPLADADSGNYMTIYAAKAAAQADYEARILSALVQP